jgi:hypothetical protein
VLMVDVETVRRIALSLPESSDGSTATALRSYVRDKQFAWTYHEQVHPKRLRQPRLDVLAVRGVANEKEGLLASDPGKFFTTDHYRGFPAVLVYLDCVDEQEIRSHSPGPGDARLLQHCDGSKEKTVRLRVVECGVRFCMHLNPKNLFRLTPNAILIVATQNCLYNRQIFSS